MERVRSVVASAQAGLHRRLKKLLKEQGKFDLEQYARFLTMQAFLTRDVQQEFYTMAGNHCLHKRKPLRKFMVKFANEEEPHYKIAIKDLEKLGLEPGEKPLDVLLWKTTFQTLIVDRPFIRFGATCVLENISETSTAEILKLVDATPELDRSNTNFLRIHMHGEYLPHGDQVFEALEQVEISDDEMDDLVMGARIGRKVYLQLVDWILTGEEVAPE